MPQCHKHGCCCKDKVVLEQVSPDVGLTSGGWLVRVVGRNLQRVIALRVGGVFLSTFRRLNSHVLLFIMPSTDAGVKDVALVTRDNEVVTGSLRTHDADLPGCPVLGAVQPSLVSYQQSSLPTDVYRRVTVTLTGQNFTGATQVLYDGVPVQFTVQNDTTIVATRPGQRSSLHKDAIAPRDQVVNVSSSPLIGDSPRRLTSKKTLKRLQVQCANPRIHAGDWVVQSLVGSSAVNQMIETQAPSQAVLDLIAAGRQSEVIPLDDDPVLEVVAVPSDAVVRVVPTFPQS